MAILDIDTRRRHIEEAIGQRSLRYSVVREPYRTFHRTLIEICQLARIQREWRTERDG